MILRLINRIKFHLNPPKKGDVYFGDPFDFVCGKLIEHVMHRTKSISGETIWQVIVSDGAYKLTIESDAMPYYRCKAEVLCENVAGYGKEWLERVQPRRISKEVFKQMIIDGRIKREQF